MKASSPSVCGGCTGVEKKRWAPNRVKPKAPIGTIPGSIRWQERRSQSSEPIAIPIENNVSKKETELPARQIELGEIRELSQVTCAQKPEPADAENGLQHHFVAVGDTQCCFHLADRREGYLEFGVSCRDSGDSTGAQISQHSKKHDSHGCDIFRIRQVGNHTGCMVPRRMARNVPVSTRAFPETSSLGFRVCGKSAYFTGPKKADWVPIRNSNTNRVR